MSSKHLTFDIRNLSFQSLLIILVLVLIPIVVLLRIRQTAVSVSAAWFNDSWQYRQAINVSSHTPAESNVYLATTINIGTTTHALSNDTDFRFTTATGQLLSYFIASGVGTTAITFHIQLPSFPAGAQTFYAYYGNPSAANSSSSSDFSSPASNYTIGSYGTEELGGGPVAYWKFDEGVGTTTYDSSPNKINLTVGAQWVTEDQCVSGKCLYFNSKNVYNTPGRLLSQNNNFTFETWMRPALPQTIGIAIYNGNDSAGYGVGVSGNTLVGLYGGVAWINSGYVFPAGNQWYHVAFERANGTTKFYVNGVQTSNTSTATPNSPNNYFEIGHEPYYVGRFYTGFLDDIKLFSYVRSVTQIRNDYNAGKAHLSAFDGSGVNLGSNPKNADALSNGLVGYWKFDENVGTSTADSSGNSNTATFSGTTIPTWSSGKFGIGISFDGSNSYAVAANSSSLNIIGKQISFGAWINASTLPPTGNYGVIFQKNGYSAGYRILINPNGQVSASIGSSMGAAFNTDTSISTNTWNHVLTTYDSQNIKIYINGNLSKSIGYTGTILDSSSQGLYFGKTEYPPITGTIDEVRIYNRALSPAEVSQLYNWAPGPVGYWKFDEGTGSSVKDISGNDNVGTWSGTGSHWVPGKYNDAGNFNGIDDHVDTGKKPNLDMGYGNYTIEGWTFITPDTQNYGNIGGKASWNSALGYGIVNNDTNIVGYLTQSDWQHRITTAGYVYQPNTWYHYAVTFERQGLMTLYVNGNKFSAVDITAYSNINFTNSSNFSIGQYDGWHMKGKIDDVKIYNYARTQKQIVEDMTGGAPAASAKSLVGYWKFDEGTGSIANNSGNGGIGLSTAFTGTSPSWINDGKFGKAIFLTGGTQTIATVYSPTLHPTEGTISLWAKLTAYNPMANLGSVLAMNYYSSTIRDWIFYVSNNGTLCLRTHPNSVNTCSSTGAVTLNVWHHFTASYTSTGEKVYLDGKLVATGTDTNQPAASSAPLKIGSWGNGLYTLFGSIDEVKFYNYALTDSEIAQDYNKNSSFSANSFSSQDTGNTAAASANSQLYCVPGDATSCPPPVAEWNFDEGTGTSLFDTSGNANHATLTSGLRGVGKFNQGLTFNGTATNYGISNNTIVFAGDFTAEVWFKTGSTQTEVILGNRGGAVVASGFSMYTSGNNLIAAYGNGTSASLGLTPSFIYADNKWHHFVFRVQRTSTQLNEVYADGKMLGSNTVTVSGNVGITYKVGIGAYYNGSFPYNGSFDQVRLYNYARTPAQIAWDYNRGTPIGWWKFDDCQGGIAYDSSGVGNTGAINIGPSGSQTSLGTCSVGTSAAWTAGAVGKINSSLNFDGVDDYVSENLSTSNFSNQFSYSVWFKKNANGSGSAERLISYPSWAFEVSGNYGNNCSFYLGWSDGSNTGWNNIQSISAGNWYHLVLTYDGSYVKAYINGIQQFSSNAWASKVLKTVSSGYFGGIPSYSSNAFNGQIDDVRIYNYALTSEQIKQVYTGGAASFR